MKPKQHLTFLLLLAANLSSGQHFSESKWKNSTTEKKRIAQFWTEFKQAINTHDKSKLATLIAFPFNCDFCHSLSPATHFYPPVTKTQFDQTDYKIFFDPKLLKMANETPELTNVLVIAKDEKEDFLGFDFSYVSIDQSSTSEGQQHFFTIKKLNGRYKIISVWTLP